MKPSQPPGGVNNNAYQTPPSTPAQKEGPIVTSQNNVSVQGGKTFNNQSAVTNTPLRSKTYNCQCTVTNANTAQDCSQYPRREDYSFFVGTGTDNAAAGGWQGWQRESGANAQAVAGAGAGGLREEGYRQGQNAGWQHNDSTLPLTACCLVVNEGQQTDGPQEVITTKIQHDGTQTNIDGNAVKLGQQGEREHFASRRHHATCRVTQGTSAPPDAPIPQPKVMYIAPPFEGITVNKGEFQDVKLSDYRGRYLCFFFYPLDFTFVCPTEIRAMSDLHDQFREVNCAILGCSCDSHFTHLAYIKTPKQNNGLGEIKFPLLSDYTKKISADYNVLTEDGTPLRALFVIDPVGIIRNITINDAGVGRNTDEVLRMVQAIKRVDDFDEMCPHDWMPGTTTVEPTRPGALNFYRKYNQKSDEKNEKQDQADACSSHIDYENEKVDML